MQHRPCSTVIQINKFSDGQHWSYFWNLQLQFVKLKDYEMLFEELTKSAKFDHQCRSQEHGHTFKHWGTWLDKIKLKYFAIRNILIV